MNSIPLIFAFKSQRGTVRSTSAKPKFNTSDQDDSRTDSLLGSCQAKDYHVACVVSAMTRDDSEAASAERIDEEWRKLWAEFFLL